jgi:hypothetical protein
MQDSILARDRVLKHEGSTRGEDRAQSREERRERNEHTGQNYKGNITLIRSDMLRFSRGTNPEQLVQERGYAHWGLIEPSHGCSDQVQQWRGIDSEPDQQNRKYEEDENTAPGYRLNRSSVLWWVRV